MKKIICFGGIGFVMILAITSCSSIAPTPNSTASLKATPSVTPYVREQTKGNVRLVLLKIDHATFFTAQNVSDAKPGEFYPVGTIGITYMIEALGREPVKTWDVGGDEITIGNRQIGGNVPGNIIPGSAGVTGYLAPTLAELPKSFNTNRVAFEEYYVRTGPGQSGVMNVTLKTGFNGHPETFVFDNLPVD